MTRLASVAFALCAALFLLAAPAARAAYPTTSCVDGTGGYNEVPLGTYTQGSASTYATTILGNATRYLTLNNAVLYGNAALSGMIDYCQGPFYDNLAVAGGSSLTVAFTTGNGSLPAYAPLAGDYDGGFQNENDSSNDRYTGNTNSAGVTGPSSEFKVSCRGPSGQTFNAYDSSALKFTVTASASGTISFPFMFASDEYPEYANPAQQYKDQMRFYARANGGDYVNVALINGQPVGIDTVNAITNADQFNLNDASTQDEVTKETNFATQYDGFTDVLTTQPFAVKAGDVLDFAIIIDDCNDRQLDSAIIVQAGAFFSLAPSCADFTFAPNPSFPGAEVEVTASFTDEPGSDITSITCTAADGSIYTCAGGDIAVSGNTASCTFTHTMTAGDFATGISCTATDSTQQTVTCSAIPALAPSPSPNVPSPSPNVPSPSPNVPSPSPSAPPSPEVANPGPPPSPTPVPSPAECEDTLVVVPPAGCPAGAPDCNPFAATCTLFTATGDVINGPFNNTCSKCQWECLTNQYCASVQFYPDTEPVPVDDLAGYNCGDEGFGSNTPFGDLCVLVGPNGVAPFPDTQHQPCFNCKEQCLTWGECTGVWYMYNFILKEDLETSLCC